MLKVNKSVHFNILTIFAIVFVCVYLYYAISDLKKIAVEVKKHGQDIANIVASLTTLSKEVGDLKKCASACKAPKVHVTVSEAPAAPPPTSETRLSSSDDASSVDTDDVKNLLGDIHEEDEVEEAGACDAQAAPDSPSSEATPEAAVAAAEPAKDYASMSFEELKAECKAAGLSAKGAKDSLVKRLEEARSASA